MIPGEIIPADQSVELNAGLPVVTISFTNTGPVPVHITSHFHVFEANPRLRFDRLRAFGMRLDIHSQGMVRFEPGETREVSLVPIGGNRIVHGFNGVINGPLDAVDPRDAVAKLVIRGFEHEEND